MLLNPALLSQARKGISAIISENKESIILFRKGTTDDGFGNKIENPYASPSEIVLVCRISHESKGPFFVSENPAGQSTDFQRYILADHKANVQAGDTFTYDSKGWIVKDVDTLKKFGGIIGYQAKIKEGS